MEVIEKFLRRIGIGVEFRSLEKSTFLPGVTIEKGGLVIDETKLAHPGDLLHEAGHVAVMDPQRRGSVVGSAGNDPGEEMAAIAWSYAALIELGLDPEIVFHPDGYHGESTAIIENFGSGRYFGVPVLAWYGMTRERAADHEPGGAVYPAMHRWLRE